jgi:SOS-response transcriptional repressor LexA
MPTDHRAKLATIKRFDQLIAYLRDEMGWPIARDSFEDVDDLFYDFTADELGIDPKTAAKIQEIKRLRPLSPKQPWGIFFVKFEPKKLPVVALRRILGQVALKKRASANSAERAAWAADDLLFVSNYGEGDERQISFAHFSRAQDGHELPTLKVLGWDNRDTALHLDAVARELSEHLAWPDDDRDAGAWRTRWRAAFTLRHREVVTTSKELSIRLAELARAIRDRIKTALVIETDNGPLTKLMKAFQTALVHDLDAEGFADMYAQTIAYGLLSARIADPYKKTADDFAAHMRTNPFLRELMETFLKVGGRRGKAGGLGIDFDELGVSEVVELLDYANMEAVVRDFGDRNPQEDPVIHFYELFLKEYDARKRMQRGVFYTPRPVVSYIARSVDELLRTEFGLADGLADTTTWGEMAKLHKDLRIPEGVSPDQDFVQILDPATGTGTFLVEAIDLIHKTLVAKWKAQGHGEKKIDALWNDYVPKHLLTRLHGYELLMAPYAIAHLKIGLRLYETGYRFGSNERARIYLTNALEPPQEFSGTFEFAIPALAHEANAVNEIKQDKSFTVVIGNPPYSGQSANTGDWITALMRAYYFVDGVPLGERNPKWLQDDYVKFMRLAQVTVDQSGIGILAYITNHGYFDNPTFRGMRKSLMTSFSAVRLYDLHGNSKKNEVRPGGGLDENVFDIQQGVGIGLFAKGLEKTKASTVSHADLWGLRGDKYAQLSSLTLAATGFSAVSPAPPFFLFVPQNEDIRAEYNSYPSLTNAMPISNVGFVTSRDEFVLAFDKKALLERFSEFRDRRISDELIQERYPVGKLNLTSARMKFANRVDWQSTIVACQYRPFDQRFICYAGELLERPRLSVMRHLVGGDNIALLSARSNKSGAMDHFYCSKFITETKCSESSTQSCVFPLYVALDTGDLLGGSKRRANISDEFFRMVRRLLGLSDDQAAIARSLTPEDIFHFAYAVFYSPGYRSRYGEFLKSDFPRLPLTRNPELFRALARLGAELVALHLLESPKLDKPITEFIGGRSPEVEKVSWDENTVWIDKAQTTGFKGVREAVWDFHIGGYQVCEKWLKDRKGRKVSKDDIAHYQKIVVALAETIRLMKTIDEVIEEHGGWPGAFQTGEAQVATAKVIPFQPSIVEPKSKERYVTCVPLVPLKAAAGAFGDPQHIENDGFEWVAVESQHRLRKGMFVAQVVGKSMEPTIPDGAWCLFRAPVEGTRQGKTVLVQLRDATDPETGQRYTVKRYESEKAAKGDSWRHERITLKPLNPDFEPIVLTGKGEGELQVIAELVEVLGGES